MTDPLERHASPGPLAPYAVAGPAGGRGQRILLVSEFFPDDLDRGVYGAYQRLRLILDGARAVERVDILFLWATADRFARRDVERRYAEIATAWNFDGAMWLCRAGRPGSRFAIRQRLSDLPWICRGVVGFFGGQPTMRSCGGAQGDVMRIALRALRPRLIIAHGQGALAALCRAAVPLPPIVADFPDIEHVRLRRAADAASGLRARIVGRAWSAMARMAERGGLGICRRALVCSEIERRNLLRIAPRADVRVVPNAVGERPRLPLPDDPTLLFVGTLFYPPNVEAMLWFLQQIWPQVRGALPDARLVVVGDGGERLRQSAAAWPGVDVRGFVGSLQECYAAARLVICPIRQGGGTRIKIIEAAAYGRPVVSTTIGAEGLAFADGREILIRDRPDEFAGACVTLLRDRQACERLGQAARDVARAQYGRAGAVALVSRMIGEIMAEDGRKPDLAGAESGQHPVAAQ